MNNEEIKQKFDMLYDYMASSKTQKYMMTFGNVMKDMMYWLIEHRQDIAEEYVEMLCSVKWKQYLTRKEAIDIVKKMRPSAVWEYDRFCEILKSLGLPCEKEYEYNTYSLWVVMNAVYSDNGEVICKLLNMDRGDIANAELIKTVWIFANNLLCDEDGKYDVRKYFL